MKAKDSGDSASWCSASYGAGSKQHLLQLQAPADAAWHPLPGCHEDRQQLLPGARIQVLANLVHTATKKVQALKVAATVDALLGTAYTNPREPGRHLVAVRLRDVQYSGKAATDYVPLDPARVELRLDQPGPGRWKGFWWLLQPAAVPVAAAGFLSPGKSLRHGTVAAADHAAAAINADVCDQQQQQHQGHIQPSLAARSFISLLQGRQHTHRRALSTNQQQQPKQQQQRQQQQQRSGYAIDGPGGLAAILEAAAAASAHVQHGPSLAAVAAAAAVEAAQVEQDVTVERCAADALTQLAAAPAAADAAAAVYQDSSCDHIQRVTGAEGDAAAADIRQHKDQQQQQQQQLSRCLSAGSNHSRKRMHDEDTCGAATPLSAPVAAATVAAADTAVAQISRRSRAFKHHASLAVQVARRKVQQARQQRQQAAIKQMQQQQQQPACSSKLRDRAALQQRRLQQQRKEQQHPAEQASKRRRVLRAAAGSADQREGSQSDAAAAAAKGVPVWFSTWHRQAAKRTRLSVPGQQQQQQQQQQQPGMLWQQRGQGTMRLTLKGQQLRQQQQLRQHLRPTLKGQMSRQQQLEQQASLALAAAAPPRTCGVFTRQQQPHSVPPQLALLRRCASNVLAAAAPACGVQQRVHLRRSQQQSLPPLPSPQQQQNEASLTADTATVPSCATPHAGDGDARDNRAPSKRRSCSLLLLMTGRETPMSQSQAQQLLAAQRAAMQGQVQAYWRLVRQRAQQRQLQQGVRSARGVAGAAGEQLPQWLLQHSGRQSMQEQQQQQQHHRSAPDVPKYAGSGCSKQAAASAAVRRAAGNTQQRGLGKLQLLNQQQLPSSAPDQQPSRQQQQQQHRLGSGWMPLQALHQAAPIAPTLPAAAAAGNRAPWACGDCGVMAASTAAPAGTAAAAGAGSGLKLQLLKLKVKLRGPLHQSQQQQQQQQQQGTSSARRALGRPRKLQSWGVRKPRSSRRVPRLAPCVLSSLLLQTGIAGGQQQQQQLLLAVAGSAQQLQLARQDVAAAAAITLAHTALGAVAAAAGMRGVHRVTEPGALLLDSRLGVSMVSTQQSMLQVVRQLQQHCACVAEQLQQLLLLWPAGAAVGGPGSCTAAAAGADAALPHDLQQLLLVCLQQHGAFQQQLLRMEQLVLSAICAAGLQQAAQQQQPMPGSIGFGASPAAAPHTAAASLAVTGIRLQQEHAWCCTLLQALSDSVSQLTLRMAAALPAAATAAALPGPPAAAAAYASGRVVAAIGADRGGVSECGAQWVGAVRGVLPTAVQHLLSAMQLLGCQGA